MVQIIPQLQAIISAYFRLTLVWVKDVNKDYVSHTEGLSVASSVTVKVLLAPPGHSAIPSLRSQFI